MRSTRFSGRGEIRRSSVRPGDRSKSTMSLIDLSRRWARPHGIKSGPSTAHKMGTRTDRTPILPRRDRSAESCAMNDDGRSSHAIGEITDHGDYCEQTGESEESFCSDSTRSIGGASICVRPAVPVGNGGVGTIRPVTRTRSPTWDAIWDAAESSSRYAVTDSASTVAVEPTSPVGLWRSGGTSVIFDST